MIYNRPPKRAADGVREVCDLLQKVTAGDHERIALRFSCLGMF